jgi:tetratricopeptide (TPR) repeat protein
MLNEAGGWCRMKRRESRNGHVSVAGAAAARRFGKPRQVLVRVDDNDLPWISRLVRTRRLPVLLAVALLGFVHPSAAEGQETDHPALRRAIESYNAGELAQALASLQAAPALLDPHDSAVRSIYTGLIRFAQGDREGAQSMFAQAVRTEPTLRLDPAVHSPSRIAVFDAARAVVVEELRSAAESAEASGDRGGALQAWLVVQDVAPEDEQAGERIAALREELRGEALRRQAELVAEATSDTTGRPPAAQPEQEEEQREPAVASSLYNPGQALAMGLVVPGLGQFYTGRPVRGVLALGVASGALAAGMLTERLEVDCRSVPVNNSCPAADVLDERTRRPYLAPAIAVAAGVALISAIDAFVTARNANARAATTLDPAGGDGPRLLLPSVTVEPDAIRAHLLRLRFH